MVHMLGINVGDNGNRCWQANKRAVALVRLNHHPVAFTHPRVGPISVDNPAINYRRVNSTAIQKCGNHRRRRRFSVRSRHRDIRLQPHQLGQHFSPPHHRQALRPRGIQLCITRLNGARDDDNLGTFKVFGLLANENLRALFFKPLGYFAALQVRPLHGISVA